MQKRIFKVGFTVVVVVLLGLTVGLLPAEAQDWETYDSFDILDPDLWFGGGDSSRAHKYIREVPQKKNELALAVEVYGPDAQNEENWAGNGLRMYDWEFTSRVKAMQVDVKVKDHEPACCDDYSWCAGSSAGILGSIFHIDPSISVCPVGVDPCNPPPGNEGCFPPDAEVHVNIRLETQYAHEPDFSEDRLQVYARVYWCETRSSCSCGEEIWQDVIARDVRVGSDNTISWEWDADNDQVIFQVNDEVPVLASYAGFLGAVGGDDTTLALGPFKDLALDVGGTNCDGDRIRGFAESAFDNVEVKVIPLSP